MKIQIWFTTKPPNPPQPNRVLVKINSCLNLIQVQVDSHEDNPHLSDAAKLIELEVLMRPA